MESGRVLFFRKENRFSDKTGIQLRLDKMSRILKEKINKRKRARLPVFTGYSHLKRLRASSLLLYEFAPSVFLRGLLLELRWLLLLAPL